MKTGVCFFDLEVDPEKNQICDFGAVNSAGGTLHTNDFSEFLAFIAEAEYVVGHNILEHDLVFLRQKNVIFENAIDTLYLSPLLFPKRPYHRLVKDDKLQTDSLNNPLNDAIQAKNLFYDEVSAFLKSVPYMSTVYSSLLWKEPGFHSFLKYMGIESVLGKSSGLIKDVFEGKICANADVDKLAESHPIGLAYALSLIYSEDIHSVPPPWVLNNFPETDRILSLLRGKPCLPGCGYCNQRYDIHLGLRKLFGFDSFRTYGGEPLQEKAAKAAVDGKSLLAIFPTGGGKSITFQLPALMAGAAENALTVVISPLQSLMKDQVDNLERMGTSEAVTINGLLDPIERAKSIERVEDGSAAMLYISPESLRSKTIEKLLLGRKINRFVIDEAHCFSAWGQDFRIDYLYIADFIHMLQQKKRIEDPIPVSCFTATAKQKVIEDIRNYFKKKLDLDLTVFRASVSRTNLKFEVVEKSKEEEKYAALRNLIEAKNCPTIVYVSRTRRAELLAERLNKDGFDARAYHGKKDKSEKTDNQDSFISGETQIMVATSAFGMGVDKKDVGLVVHYEISDSLENYVQEAGRAGRDENVGAECFVLYDDEDLSKHFILLNQTKLTIKEIQQVWKAIKDLTKFRLNVSNSALEIARKAGWDDSIMDIETRVTSAIAALEDAGYLKRGQNMPRIFASSIQSRNAQEAIYRIGQSSRFAPNQKEKAVRIIRKLFSSKSRQKTNDEEAEARVDYIADHLGIVKEDVIQIIQLLREEKILADAKDLKAFLKKSDSSNRSLDIVDNFGKLENFLLPKFSQSTQTFNIKSLHDEATQLGMPGVGTFQIRTVLNYWAVKNWLQRSFSATSKNHVRINLTESVETLKAKFLQRHALAKFIVRYLYEKAEDELIDLPLFSGEMPVEFSIQELKDSFEAESSLFAQTCTTAEVEDALFYLTKIEAMKIDGGFLVLYNRLSIERTELDNRSQYKKEDYQKLDQFYENKIQQIHIVGEYAKKMISDYQQALKFVEDYFQMNYPQFLSKYFRGSRQDEISRNITPKKFRQLFGDLSPAQLNIIKDKDSKYIVVAAGPGSGKTRILAHKLASLLLMEDVKHEQLLMLTFSRAAVTEFKKRLMGLIGNAALYVEISTFHAFCFDILGKMGSLGEADEVIQKATRFIREGKVETKQVTKAVLVIDEAQDMSSDEFALVEALMVANEGMRVIAVGDDDQNIFGFRGSSSEFLEKLVTEKGAVKYELVDNYRSKVNLVDFTNQWATTISHRLKQNPIVSKDLSNGTVSLTKYVDKSFIPALVQDLLDTDLSGSVAVLTKTNDEALKVAGLIRHHQIPVRLIQEVERFDLTALQEVRCFFGAIPRAAGISTISAEDWDNARLVLKREFGRSSKYTLVNQMLEDFERVQPKTRFISDLETFMSESNLEDFYRQNSDEILVSTIHKAKGKEFDQVFMLLQSSRYPDDAERRLFYVGMTRAKTLLSVHCGGSYLDGISVPNLESKFDSATYPEPNILVMHLFHKDVWLSFFHTRQRQVSRLRAGDVLHWNGQECLDAAGNAVLRFSQSFMKTIEGFREKGYLIQKVSVNWLVYWWDSDKEKEALIVLPEVEFGKKE